MSTRLLEVDAARFERWVGGFERRHGPAQVVVEPEVLSLTAEDGATAICRVPFPPIAWPGADQPAQDLAAAVVEHAVRARRVLAVLVRRGGYACAALDGETVTASKVGSRYVQSRTAAGGWSQQRFARRRENQAAGLVGSVVEVALRVLVPSAGAADLLVTGGDRPLVDDVLADRRLTSLARLPRGTHLQIRDPKADLVADLARRLRLIRITITEPDRDGAPMAPDLPRA